MAGRFADGRYDRNAPGSVRAGDAFVDPSGYSSNEQRLTALALAAQLGPTADELRGLRPRFAKAPLFPPRFGYPQDVIGIEDVIQVDRRYPDSSAETSGNSGSYAGSTAPSLGWW